jgi:methanogenic corrinoid protein MtbC1
MSLIMKIIALKCIIVICAVCIFFYAFGEHFGLSLNSETTTTEFAEAVTDAASESASDVADYAEENGVSVFKSITKVISNIGESISKLSTE